jgi:hypothetical protein
MDVNLASPTFLVLLTAGFAVSLWNAAARRDGPSMLAMAMAGVGTAHLAGLPAWLLVWGCTLFTIAVATTVTGLLVRWITGCDAFPIAMISTIAVALLLVAHHQRLLPAALVTLDDQSLALGSQLHQQVDALVRR